MKFTIFETEIKLGSNRNILRIWVSETKLKINYSFAMEMLIKTQLPTEWGDFEVFAYQNVENDAMPHLALVSKNFNPEEIVTVRIHSECLTGDIFKSKRCDCGEQLNMAMIKIAKDNGILLYMRQEGRGIGIVNKLNAYNLQDEGMNTYEANQHLGLEADGRHYRDAIIILKSLCVEKINLLTNNPLKIDAFRNSGIVLYKRIPITALPKKENKFYLHTKKIVKGHLIDNI